MANTLTFSGFTLTEANIFGGISYTADMNTGEEFTIGNTAAASVSFITDTQLPLYTKNNIGGTFTWEQDGVSRGRFYITEVVKESGHYTITAYDAMILLDTGISALSITFPATVSALASAIATYCGCTVSGTINNGNLSVTELEEDLSIRALLGYIAEASGCSVKVNTNDQLCFMYYADSGITLTASDYITLEVADYTCAAIDNVTIFNSAGEIQATAGTGGNSLYIGQNPFLENATNANANTILSQVSGIVYSPLTASLFDEEGLEIGTMATFGTAHTLIMHIDSSTEEGATVSSVGSDSRADYNKSMVVIANEAKAVAVDAQSIASAASGLLSDMQTAAQAAGTTLTAIYATAEAADTVLSGMQAAATAAGTTLNGIYQDAADAKTSASNASEYAARALGNLSTVQNVTETLNWITQHGTMTLTTDTALDPTHVYFVVDANGDYVVGGTHYSVVTEPDVADISTYYELSIDESLNNYVATHLAVDSEGLWIIPDGAGSKVLIATGSGSTYSTAGTYIIGKVNGVDTVLAAFGASGARIGNTDDITLTLSNTGAVIATSTNNDFDWSRHVDIITINETFNVTGESQEVWETLDMQGMRITLDELASSITSITNSDGDSVIDAVTSVNGRNVFLSSEDISTGDVLTVTYVAMSGGIETAGSVNSAITACGASGASDKSLSTIEDIINLTSYRGKAGLQLEVFDDGVLCRKDGVVEVSGTIYFKSGFTAGDIVHLIIKKGKLAGTNLINAAHRMAGNYDYFSIAPIVIGVSAGDRLYLKTYNQTASRGTVDAGQGSWLTVKYV